MHLSFFLIAALLEGGYAGSLQHSQGMLLPPHDAVIPEKPLGVEVSSTADLKYKWMAVDGSIHDDEIFPGDMLELAATQLIQEEYFEVGGHIISTMMKNSPVDVFYALVDRGSVGFFTWTDKTTIFPEYAHLRDRPECEGTCAGSCSNTCTADGRKYDSLAGLGGIRATCVDSNYMCLGDDPYGNMYSVLVHEFAHTIHQYALPYSSEYWDLIYQAWLYALANEIWDPDSYAMVNHLEYFAEASGVFFNVNFHPISSGGMNGCGKPPGQFCDDEIEARDWLRMKDPLLFDALSFTYTDHNPDILGGMTVCPARNSWK